MKEKKLLILNGSISGANGNCGILIKWLIKKYASQFKIDVAHLKNEKSLSTQKKLQRADAFLFVTGTYWESWGSPLQKFFEDFTAWEATEMFVGKPAGSIVLSHSVGGKSVVSRIQANMNLFGCVIPPFCGMELSLIGQLSVSSKKKNVHAKDVWQVRDIGVIIKNLYLGCSERVSYQSWGVDAKNFRKVWINKKFFRD